MPCGIQLSDDCGREVAEQVSYDNESLAATTTDALQLFLREVNRFELLTASRRSTSQAHRARRPRRPRS